MSKGYTLEEIRQALHKKCRIEDLPYLNELKWTPSSTLGAPEILQIGTRGGKKVFASFGVERPRNFQVIIFRYGGANDEMRITQKDMRSVKFLQPFSYWTSKVEAAKVAPKLRMYLKACFALRGHVGDSLVVLDLRAFTDIVSVIESARNDDRQVRRSGTHANEHAYEIATRVCHMMLSVLQCDLHIRSRQHHQHSFKIIPTRLKT